MTLKCIFCPGPRWASVAKPQLCTVVTYLLPYPLYWFPSLPCLTSLPPTHVSLDHLLINYLHSNPYFRRNPNEDTSLNLCLDPPGDVAFVFLGTQFMLTH